MNGKVEDIFRAVMEYIRKEDDVDLEHLYIDGSKFEANANKYTWVWKKSTEKFRYRLFAKITQLLDQISLDTPDCVESSLKVHVSNLRRKLREAGAGEVIEAVWGIGFKLAE